MWTKLTTLTPYPTQMFLFSAGCFFGEKGSRGCPCKDRCGPDIEQDWEWPLQAGRWHHQCICQGISGHQIEVSAVDRTWREHWESFAQRFQAFAFEAVHGSTQVFFPRNNCHGKSLLQAGRGRSRIELFREALPRAEPQGGGNPDWGVHDWAPRHSQDACVPVHSQTGCCIWERRQHCRGVVAEVMAWLLWKPRSFGISCDSFSQHDFQDQG